METMMSPEMMDQKMGCMKTCMSMCDEMLAMTARDPSANSGRVATIRSLIADARMYCHAEMKAAEDVSKKEESDAPDAPSAA